MAGALRYDFHGRAGEPRDPSGIWIGGTLVGSPQEMARQAAPFRRLRPDTKNAVWRCSLNLPPSDGRLDQDKWAEIVRRFLEQMGVPPGAAWCAVQHQDRDHDHVHITVLRTLPDGKLWDRANDVKRAINACGALETEFNLAQHDRSRKPKSRRPTRGEIEMEAKKGEPMTREVIQIAVDEIMAAHPTLTLDQLQAELAQRQIELKPYAPKGALVGVSYVYGGVPWPGSKLGAAFTPKGLMARGLVLDNVPPSATETAALVQPSEPVKPSILHPLLTMSTGFDGRPVGKLRLATLLDMSLPGPGVPVTAQRVADRLAKYGLTGIQVQGTDIIFLFDDGSQASGQWLGPNYTLHALTKRGLVLSSSRPEPSVEPAQVPPPVVLASATPPIERHDDLQFLNPEELQPPAQEPDPLRLDLLALLEVLERLSWAMKQLIARFTNLVLKLLGLDYRVHVNDGPGPASIQRHGGAPAPEDGAPAAAGALVRAITKAVRDGDPAALPQLPIGAGATEQAAFDELAAALGGHRATQQQQALETELEELRAKLGEVDAKLDAPIPKSVKGYLERLSLRPHSLTPEEQHEHDLVMVPRRQLNAERLSLIKKINQAHDQVDDLHVGALVDEDEQPHQVYKPGQKG